MKKPIPVTNQELTWAKYYLSQQILGQNTKSTINANDEIISFPKLILAAQSILTGRLSQLIYQDKDKYQDALEILDTLAITTGSEEDQVSIRSPRNSIITMSANEAKSIRQKIGDEVEKNIGALKTIIVSELYSLKYGKNEKISILPEEHIDQLLADTLALNDTDMTNLNLNLYLDQESKESGDSYMKPFNYKVKSSKENIYASVITIDYGSKEGQTYNIKNYKYQLNINLFEVNTSDNQMKYISLNFQKPCSGTYNIRLFDQTKTTIDELVVKVDGITELFIGNISSYKMYADITLDSSIIPAYQHESDDQYSYNYEVIGESTHLIIE